VRNASAGSTKVFVVANAVAVAIARRAPVELRITARRARLVGACVAFVEDLVQIAIRRSDWRGRGRLASADVRQKRPPTKTPSGSVS
jgi:hypothetical protein